MNLEFIQPAEQEFFEAVNYLNSESEGLGYEFAAEIRSTLERIVQYPDAWHPLSKRTRRCRTKRFPYSIVYQVRPDMILVIAVMHMHRDPKTWKSRLGSG
ncbi:type II toxin-antitoxin system RelE/ParE family toxin [bacterium]|nr:type II toxin-antitoxin system RelE/ParE family toxin [bacterium]